MTEVWTNRDQQWNVQCDELIEFKQKNGNGIVPRGGEQDKHPGWRVNTQSLGLWVDMQRNLHVDDKMRQDPKELLDEIGFVWKAEGPHHSIDNKRWHQQCEKLVDFKRKNDHCLVPQRCEQDKSLWVVG